MSVENDNPDLNINPSSVVDNIQLRRLEWLSNGVAPDKDLLKLAKDASDTALKQLTIQSNDRNASQDREVILATADVIRNMHSNPFALVDNSQVRERLPERPEGPIIDIELTDENTSTSIGSPSYDELMSRKD